MDAPVRYDARSPHRNAATAASSSAVPGAPGGHLLGDQVGDRLVDRGGGHVHDAPPPALTHSGHDRFPERHRGQHERAVRGLPLLGREAERVGAGGRAARVAHEHLDGAAERGLAIGDEVRGACEVPAVPYEPGGADLGSS